ncbi:OLC1v1016901C1 [Oldenlandia corymbosa var. corymbosa]|uniref:OLC1v1016901C1 n=1 Tax=Oldenlandia corymbosa var. corymbosa TaxID=529605 RepID=A0AAV1E879_OLDCO|nr:OLC1v1016901C1 [Oldenlandia corymbosa var. corymbosa]
MKRSVPAEGDSVAGEEEITAALLKKKTKLEEDSGAVVVVVAADLVLSDENLLYEVLKHVDGRTLAASACVNKQWSKTAQDERLWELICTEHYSKIPVQLRSVVLALGGFRRLFSLYLWPLLKPTASASSSPVSSAWPCLPAPVPPVAAKPAGNGMKKRWGKDEVNLSLSLLSIRYFETMNFNNRAKAKF